MGSRHLILIFYNRGRDMSIGKMRTFTGTRYTKKYLLKRVRMFAWEKDYEGLSDSWVNYGHKKLFEEYYGVPEPIAHIADVIFENLPGKKAKKFAMDLAKSIPQGVDLGLVWPKFAQWVIADEEYGVINYMHGDSEKRAKKVAGLHERIVEGVTISKKELADNESSYRHAVRASNSDCPYSNAKDAISAASRVFYQFSPAAATRAHLKCFVAGDIFIFRQENNRKEFIAERQKNKLIELIKSTGEIKC